CELREGHRRADFEALLVDRDLAHLLDAVDVDQDRGPNDAPAHVHDKVGAAPKEPAVRKIGSRLDDIPDRTGSDDRKAGQDFHQRCPDRRCFSIAPKTRSGVIGRFSKRIPMASSIAFASAGRNAASEPSPASLAPNGPCGSLLSTIPTSMSGESTIVGMR